ncbi:hypothetical protein STAFG_7662 [Streptomyces afghaniensis 772]|uniref:Uncharacterized protein n=1 Tax=Streptomyces afghaniensis 772 TaxID=1283301 RepID=S4MIA4_9ACTN|nr:hypothetical protein STAFG_7662 [Streptomyces afghaniensis 772]
MGRRRQGGHAEASLRDTGGSRWESMGAVSESG